MNIIKNIVRKITKENPLTIKGDEFDDSLNMDIELLLELDEKGEKKYRDLLLRRRIAAHEKDLEKYSQ